MKRNSKLIAVCIALCLILSCSSALAATETDGGEIVIYHTNDIHGAAAWSEGGSIGLDRVAALKKQTQNAILVDAGDATQGLPFASLTKGADVIEVMNAAGYDAMAAGNHEFDFGTEQLFANVARAEFPILAANVYMDGSPLLANEDHDGCHVIIERGGKKIGFFGIVTAKTATSTNPAMIVDVEFKDEIETAKAEIDALTAEGADAIIAIAHVGEYTNVPCDSAKLAEAMTGEYGGRLDAIIDGHSHTEETELINGVLVMQTGTGLTNLGKITLEFGDDGALSTIGGELLTYEEIMEQVEPDPDVTGMIEQTTAEMMGLLSEPVAQSETTLWGGTVDGVAEARVVETNLGSFAADAYRDAAERFIEQAAGMEAYRGLPVIGAENGGGVRASLPNGVVTKGDLINVFPLANTLIIKEITPAILYETLEVSVSSIAGQDAETGLLSGEPSGGFLQVSGVRFTYDPNAPQGEKVLEAVLEESGTVLERTDSETRLMLASNNFIMSGGSRHAALAELPLVGEIGGEMETVEAYLIARADGAALKAQGVKGRIIPQGGYMPRDYTAYILIEREDGGLAADTPVTYYVDGGSAMEGRTDSEGILAITVSDGPHGVKLATEQREVYTNNYTGAGTVETEYRGYPVLTLAADTAIQPEAAPEQPASPPEASEATDPPEAAPEAEKAPFPWGLVVAGVIAAGVILYVLLRGKNKAEK